MLLEILNSSFRMSGHELLHSIIVSQFTPSYGIM